MTRMRRLSITTVAVTLAVLSSAFMLALAAERSSLWPTVRKAHIEVEPYCALCGCQHDLEVHHIKPFHLHPELELAETNLITLCRHCHLEAGHLGNWTNDVDGIREIIGDVGLRLYRLRTGRDKSK